MARPRQLSSESRCSTRASTSQGTSRQSRPGVRGSGVETCCLPSSHTRGPSTWPESPAVTSLPRGQPGRRRTASIARCLHGHTGFPTRSQPQRRLGKGGREPQRSEGAGSGHSQTRARPLPATRRRCKACLPRR